MDKKNMVTIGFRALAVGIASATLAFAILNMLDARISIILLSIGLLAVSIMPLTAE